MFVYQELYYTTRGNYRYTKRIGLVYKISPNGIRDIVQIVLVNDGEVINPSFTPIVRLPDIETTPRTFKVYENKRKNLIGKA